LSIIKESGGGPGRATAQAPAITCRRRVLEFLITEIKDIMPAATWAGIGRHQLEVNR
jgi:hypothetical protein